LGNPEFTRLEEKDFPIFHDSVSLSLSCEISWEKFDFTQTTKAEIELFFSG